MSGIGVLLVGAGIMGANHASAVTRSDRAHLVGVVDPDERGGRRIADASGAPWFPELPDLADVDALIVAAPTEYHHAIALDAIGRGIPLLVEKPLTPDLATTEELVRLADERDIPLMCGLLERYNPAVLTAQRLVEHPVHVSAIRHSPYTPRIRTGVAWDLLIHDADLAIRMLGEPTSVTALTSRVHDRSPEGSEDVAEVLLGFEDGAIANLSASRIGQRKIRTMSIYEPTRLVEVDLLRRDVTIYNHVSESLEADRGYKQQTVIEIAEVLSAQDPLSAQLSVFADLVEGRGDAAAERATILPAHRAVQQVASA